MGKQSFVARDRELARLGSFLDRALENEGQVCFVVGNAGSGKTALAAEFARRAQEAHTELLVAVGTCNAQTGIGDPYLPFRELLGLLTGDVEGKLAQGAVSQENARRLRAFFLRSVQVLVEVGPDLVGSLLPGSRLLALAAKAVVEKVGWMDRLDKLAIRKPARPLLGAALTDQARIFEQCTKVLRLVAKEHPLVLVLDDLQWADLASTSLLFHLGRSLRDSRILLIGTYRPADVALGRAGERHPLESAIHEFKRYYGDIWVDLDQAVESGGRQFVDRWLDTEPNRLGEDFRRALFFHTDGHPLFTIELLQHMQERGDLVHDPLGQWVEGSSLDWGALPARVEGVIQERVGRLGQELRDILAVASVEGEEFTAEVIARVQNLEPRELVRRMSRELETQHRLVRAQGIRRLRSGHLSLYQFWHNLFQRYLYASLDEAERVYLHADVGTALEALYGGQAQEIALQLARHFEAAGVSEKAIDYLCQAGEQALAVYAAQEAIEHLTRAAGVAERCLMAPPSRLHRIRGHAFELLGEFEPAHTDLQAALAAARPEGDRQAEWQALLDLGELWASRDYVRTGEYYRKALEHARVLDHAPAIAHTLNRMGNWHLNIEQPREALRYHEEALGIFEQLNDQSGVAETLDLLGMASVLGGDLRRSAAYYDQAVDLFLALDNRRGLVSSLAESMGGWDYLSDTLAPGEGARTECLAHGERALEIAREINYRSGEAYALLSLGVALGPIGDYARALEYAQAGLGIAVEIEHRQWMATAHCALGALYLDLLALSHAQAYLERGLALAREVGSLFWTRCVAGFLASTYVQQQELALARSLLEATIEPDAPLETLGQRLPWCARAELALAAGEPAQALQLADQLIASALNLTPGQTVARLSRLRGEALAAQHRTGEAEAELQAALETARVQGTPPLQWRVHKSLGGLYEAASRSEAAERHFGAARRIVGELAAKVPDEEVRREFLRRADLG